MTDNKYLNGKIYKIVNDLDDDIYIGSTTQNLNKRFGDHKSNIHNRKCTLYKKMILLGTIHFTIELIEDYPCSTKYELMEREEYWRTTLNAKLNDYVCATEFSSVYSEQGKKEYMKLYHQMDYEMNKEHLIEYQKEYNKNNHEKVTTRQKQYYENKKDDPEFQAKRKEYSEKTKDQSKARSKQWYENNKQKLKEEYLCTICMSKIKICSKGLHDKNSKYHQKFVQLNDQIKNTNEMYQSYQRY